MPRLPRVIEAAGRATIHRHNDALDPTVKARESDEFRRQCERQLARPLWARIRYGFFRNANPVRDSNRNRAFDSMQEYRRFCEEHYPPYFGYSRPRRAGHPA